jgi:hypothetical protein
MIIAKKSKTIKKEIATMITKLNVQDFILGSLEVQERLLVNRSRLKALVDAGKLEPVKELKRELLFWAPDVERLKAEMMKDTRTNLFKAANE